MGQKAAQSRKSSFLLFSVSVCQKNGIRWFDVNADAKIQGKIWSCLLPLANQGTGLKKQAQSCLGDVSQCGPLMLASHRGKVLGVKSKALGGET